MGTNEPPEILPGTLDLLSLQILHSAVHGYGTASRLENVSDDVLLQVGERSLDPARNAT